MDAAGEPIQRVSEWFNDSINVRAEVAEPLAPFPLVGDPSVRYPCGGVMVQAVASNNGVIAVSIGGDFSVAPGEEKAFALLAPGEWRFVPVIDANVVQLAGTDTGDAVSASICRTRMPGN